MSFAVAWNKSNFLISFGVSLLALALSRCLESNLENMGNKTRVFNKTDDRNTRKYKTKAVSIFCGLHWLAIHHYLIASSTHCSNIVEGMMTSSNGDIFRVTGHSCGDFIAPCEVPAQRPMTQSFDVFFDPQPNKGLSKHWWGWWFQTPPCPLWRHRNGKCRIYQHTSTFACPNFKRAQ